MTAVLITTGVQSDYGRTVTGRQKDQVMADGAAMAAMLSLPRSSASVQAGNRVLAAYRSSYNANFTSGYTFYPAGSTVPKSVRVDISEQVPSLLPGIMSAAKRTTSA